MTNIEIYTKNLCVFCDRAKNYFKSRNLHFSEYNSFTYYLAYIKDLSILKVSLLCLI